MMIQEEILQMLDVNIKNKSLNLSVNGRINAKDLYEEMKDGRKFELEHLWQRSVFLGTFLVAIMAGYGSIIMKMYFEKSTPNSFQQGVASGICWLGIVFSMLWIMMAKGSKYWSERYETAIMWFEGSYKYYDDISDSDIPYYGSMPEPDKKRICDSLFSTFGGRYSMSKVNVAIGIVALIIWGFLCMLHFGLFLKSKEAWHLASLQCALFSILQLFGIGMIVYAVLTRLCKSGS